MTRARRSRRSPLRLLVVAVACALSLATAALVAPTLLLVATLKPCEPAPPAEDAETSPPCPRDPPAAPRGDPAWGGYANGRIPPGALCPLGPGSRHRLRCDAADAFQAMAAAHQAELGRPLHITDAYRDLAAQRRVAVRKPQLAARPGTSRHGWGLAVDLVVGGWHGETFRWLQRNAPRFGWHHPAWAHHNGSKPEPWHWEFDASLTAHRRG